MHPQIYMEFERLVSTLNVAGSVLEVGAVPSEMSLLCMKSLDGATEKVGINLDGPHEFMDFRIHRGNANSMELFEDERFDVVLCNAMLEHDRFFWKSIAEIKRVTRPGGVIVIGTPGYKYYNFEKFKTILKRTPLIRHLSRHRYLNMFFEGTITFEIHDAPGDYYRFSPQAFKDVFFDDMDDVEILSVMLPPRLIGIGTKRSGTEREE